MRVLAAVTTVAVVAAFVAGCGDGEEARVDPSMDVGPGSESPGASATPSPRELPTLPVPTAPPTAPTDVVPGDVVTGRVTALSPGCVEVTTDDDVVWSLSGDAGSIAVDDSVLARIEGLPEGEQPCGSGQAGALVSIRSVA